MQKKHKITIINYMPRLCGPSVQWRNWIFGLDDMCIENIQTSPGKNPAERYCFLCMTMVLGLLHMWQLTSNKSSSKDCQQ